MITVSIPAVQTILLVYILHEQDLKNVGCAPGADFNKELVLFISELSGLQPNSKGLTLDSECFANESHFQMRLDNNKPD